MKGGVVTSAVQVFLTCDRNQTSLICAAQSSPVSDLPMLFVSSSSPKSKQEVMVRPPTVMSPSGNPQLDSKFSNQGKQGGSASQSQPSPCDSKSGGHTPKALPGPGGSMGLKNGAGNGAKGKGKRERSISADSFDQRDPGDGPDLCLLYNVTNLHPQFFRHPIRSNPLNLFVTSTV